VSPKTKEGGESSTAESKPKSIVQPVSTTSLLQKKKPLSALLQNKLANLKKPGATDPAPKEKKAEENKPEKPAIEKKADKPAIEKKPLLEKKKPVVAPKKKEPEEELKADAPAAESPPKKSLLPLKRKGPSGLAASIAKMGKS